MEGAPTRKRALAPQQGHGPSYYLSCLGGRMADLEATLSRFRNVRRVGKGWTAECPAHEDRSQDSLKIDLREERILLRCFAGCTFVDVVRAANLPQGILGSTVRSMPSRELPLAEQAFQSVLHHAKRLLPAWDTYPAIDWAKAQDRTVALLRGRATQLGDCPEAWDLLEEAAAIERHVWGQGL